jgi:hypothetical protein
MTSVVSPNFVKPLSTATSPNGIPKTAPAMALLSSALNRAGVPPAIIAREKSLGWISPLLFR